MRGKKGIRYIGITLLLASMSVGPLMSQTSAKGWQEAKSINANFKAVSALPDMEAFSSPNTIMLKIHVPTEVRIFTILGKLISSQQLQPGIYQYHLEAHGIYLIKTDFSSCKIAV